MTNQDIKCENCKFFHPFEDWERGKDADSFCCTMFVRTETKRENQIVVKVESDDKCEMFTPSNNELKEYIKRTGLSIAPEDGSKPYGYDCEDKVWRSDVIDLFGHGSTYTSEEAQKMIKELPSAD